MSLAEFALVEEEMRVQSWLEADSSRERFEKKEAPARFAHPNLKRDHSLDHPLQRAGIWQSSLRANNSLLFCADQWASMLGLCPHPASSGGPTHAAQHAIPPPPRPRR